MDAIDAAIHNTAHKSLEVSAEELAEKIGMSYQVFINKTNPNCETHQATIHQVVAMMLGTKNPQVYDAIGAKLRKAGVIGGTNQVGIFDAVMNKVAEGGDVVRVVRDALADKVISPREQDDIMKKISKERGALATLEDAVLREGQRHGSGVAG